MSVNKKHISVKLSKTKLKQRNKELSILLDISNVLSASLNLNELLDKVLNKVLRYFGYDAGRIYFLEEDKNILRLASHVGIDPSALEELKINGSFSGKAIRTGSFIAQHVSELEDKNRAAFLIGLGFKIIVCVPLMVSDEIVGVMNLMAKKSIELDEQIIDLLVAIGNYIAISANHAKLYRDLKIKYEETNNKSNTIKFLSYSISHDLKSPVIGIYGLTKRLYDKYNGELDEDGKNYCVQILKAAEHMAALVEKINAYIRTKEEKVSFQKVKIKEILEMVKNEFSDKLVKLNVTWVEPDIVPVITADDVSITRVFQNLVDNALKYGGESLSKIEIGYRKNKDYHIFSVTDDGIPLRREDSEKLFNKFERFNQIKKIEGTGLGLAIVKEIAKKHGGNAWLESSGGKGKTFYVSVSKKMTSNP